jgi:hypothetical protein
MFVSSKDTVLWFVYTDCTLWPCKGNFTKLHGDSHTTTICYFGCQHLYLIYATHHSRETSYLLFYLCFCPALNLWFYIFLTVLYIKHCWFKIFLTELSAFFCDTCTLQKHCKWTLFAQQICGFLTQWLPLHETAHRRGGGCTCFVVKMM